MLRLFATLSLLCAASCSAPAPVDAPTVVVERFSGGELIAIDSDSLVDGRRPKLILECRPGLPATFRLDLVQPPAGAPPQRVFAQMQVKGGPKVTIELGWLEGALWAPKMPDPKQPEFEAPDRNNQERVVPILHAFSRERALTITPPADYGPKQELVWSPATYMPQLEAVQSCAALERFTSS
jgi:hypothetical protein